MSRHTRQNSEKNDKNEVDEVILEKALDRMVTSDNFLKKLVSIIKEEIKSTLKDIYTEQSQKIMDLESKIAQNKHHMDNMEQQLKLSNLRIYGLKEEPNEKLSDVIISLGVKMNITISNNDLSNCYRLKENENGIKPIIVSFTNRRVRDQLFNNKKKLKGSKIVIQEDLTTVRLVLLKRAKTKFGPYCVWTRIGTIFIKNNQKIFKQLNLLK